MLLYISNKNSFDRLLKYLEYIAIILDKNVIIVNIISIPMIQIEIVFHFNYRKNRAVKYIQYDFNIASNLSRWSLF